MKKTEIYISKEHSCRGLQSLSSILLPLAKEILKAEDFVEADILLNWYDVIGAEMAAYVNPVKVRFNPRTNIRTLFVEVPAGGFALELQHKETYILEKINAYFGYKAVHKINITQNMNMHPRIPALKKAKKEAKLTPDEENSLNELVEGMDNEKLKEILLKLGKSVIISQKGVK